MRFFLIDRCFTRIFSASRIVSPSTSYGKFSHSSLRSLRSWVMRKLQLIQGFLFDFQLVLVILSWVSFWLNREATADRISLGITTVLTMTFLGLESRTDLPKVSYPTALDFFVFISFAFIFATILQFAIVHYFTKVKFKNYLRWITSIFLIN